MRSDGSVLVVEDEEAQRRIIADILGRDGYEVREAGCVDEALDVLGDFIPDVVLCDWRMPGRSGGDLLAEIGARGLEPAFIVMTAYGSIAHAVEAVRMGANDYLSKPFERESLLLAVRRVVRTRRLEAENRRLREEVNDRRGFGEFIGGAPSMQSLYRAIEKVAATDATVLVAGESGTGKELVARTLHRNSHRAAKPFVAVNCAAIPESLIESELFGHERGAFTGALRRRDGRFAEAEGGTLFLDEIASMPLALQATLLRVLQEKSFTRIGATGELSSDVRVIAATNSDLPAMVAQGEFREDLYYRLNVVALVVPPLRERRVDIPLLAQTFLQRASERHGIEVGPMPPDVLRCLMEHGWRGNVRELGNAVERLVLLAEGPKVRAEDLPPEVRQRRGRAGCPVRLPAEGLVWDEMERELIRQAMERAAGNRAAAARLVGLGYKAFLYRLEKHSLA